MRSPKRTKIGKAGLLAGTIVAAVVLYVFVAGFLLPMQKLKEYENVYSKLRKGDRVQLVYDLLGSPYRTNVPAVEFWEGQKLDPKKISSISTTIEYGVQTFFLPITYRFSFDTSGILVGKHRYD